MAATIEHIEKQITKLTNTANRQAMALQETQATIEALRAILKGTK